MIPDLKILPAYDTQNLCLKNIYTSQDHSFTLSMSRPARAKYTGATFTPLYVPVCFYRYFFIAKKVTAQIFLRLYIHAFLSEIFKTFNIDDMYYEIYISMTAVMQILIVRDIQQFKAR